MHSFILKLLLLLSVCLSLQVIANEVYKIVDDEGNIKYSDTAPNNNAEPVSLPDLNVEPGITPRVRLSPDQQEGLAPIQIWIASPQNDGVINPGALSFSVSGGTNRALAETEYAQLLVNGSPYGGQSKVLQWSIGQLFRGEYQLEIQIFSNGANQASSGTTTVFVQRAVAR